MSASLHAALVYAARGFSVIPTHGKEPHFEALREVSGSPGWARFQESSASASEIQAWYEVAPDAGVGIITGSVSGVAVADIEQHALHDPQVERLLTIRTPTARTPGGGRHLYFRIDNPIPKRKSTWGDLQAEGAYVVAPSGGPDREWQFGPGEVPFASISEAPELLALLEPPREGSTPREYSPKGNRSQDEQDQTRLSELALWDSDPAYISAMARLLGIPERLGQKFGCILPGHGPDSRPSANLWRAPESGHVLYRCWHDSKTYPLCRVYQAFVAGRPLDDKLLWTAGIHAIWKLRTLLDTGLVAPPALPATPAADDLHPRVVEHLPSILRFFQARALSINGLHTTLTPRFLGPWCGINNDAARDFRHQLRRAGLIEKTGAKEGFADLYRLVERNPAKPPTATMPSAGDA